MAIFRRGGATYFIRVHIPRARHADVGRAFGARNGVLREIVRTLETTDRGEAQQRAKDAEAEIWRDVNAKLRAAGIAPIGRNWKASWMDRALVHRARIAKASADKVLYVEEAQDGTESAAVTERDHVRDEVIDEVRDEAASLRATHGPEAAERFRAAIFEDRLTFADAARRWPADLRRQGKVNAQTIAGHEAVFALFRAFLTERNLAAPVLALADVSRRLASDFIRWRQDMPSSKGKGTITPATIRRELSSLSGLWRWARREGAEGVETNPWEDQASALPPRAHRAVEGDDDDEAGGVKRAYTSAELVKLLRATGAEWAPNGSGYGAALWDAMRLGLLTGLRANELAGLRCGDVKDDGAAITVRTGKTRNARRTLPLCAAAQAVLRARLAVLPSATDRAAALFPEIPTGGADDRRGPMLAKRFVQAMRRILGLPAVGLSDVDMHSLRRSFAQALRNAMEQDPASIAETTIGALMGHTERSMALRVYGRETLEERARSAVDAMEAHGFHETVRRALNETAGQRPPQLRIQPAARPKHRSVEAEPTAPKRRERLQKWLVARRAAAAT